MSKKSSFALVIPCYNEEEVIPHFREELSSFYDAFISVYSEVSLQVVIVDNNSTDKSLALLKEFAKNNQYVQITGCLRRGYGAALKCGFAAVQADFYAFADLDNTYPLRDFIAMLSLFLDKASSVDMVSGGRLNTTSEIPWLRRFGNTMYSKLAHMLFPYQIIDTCSGMRIFRHARKSEILKMHEDDLSFSIELTAHALKHQWRLKEFPIFYRERLGASKLSVIKDGFKFLYILIYKRFSNA